MASKDHVPIERGFRSVYFRDGNLLKELEELLEKDLGGKEPLSHVVCQILGGAVPQIRVQAKKGVKKFKVEFTLEF